MRTWDLFRIVLIFVGELVDRLESMGFVGNLCGFARDKHSKV